MNETEFLILVGFVYVKFADAEKTATENCHAAVTVDTNRLILSAHNNGLMEVDTAG
jgi:hypothetical protein